MDVTPDTKKLVGLVEQAQAGTLALPQFQRNFVWDRQSIDSLLSSLLKGYYIGALLFLETDKEHMPFGHRPIAGLYSNPNGAIPEDLVLDGQQRITALHYVFTGPDLPLRWTSYAYRFFLDLDKLDGPDEEAVIWSERADIGQVKQLESPQAQFESKTLPLTELLRWEDWKQGYVQWLLTHNSQAVVEHLGGEQASWDAAVRRIRDARVPVITLPKVDPQDHQRVREVCDIFEKLNSTGLKLTVFDLLTARLYRGDPYGVDLHALWRNSLQNYPLLRRFAGGEPNLEDAESDDFGVLLLRTVALLRDQEVKSKKLIELSSEGFEADWERASEAMELALERVTSTSEGGFGAFGRRWLPYKTILPVLAALLASFKEEKLGAEAYATLRRWYWGSVFLGRYAGATESIMYLDYHEVLRRARGEDFEPTVFSDARRQILENPSYSLREVSRVSAAAYKGVMNLVALAGAKDFSTNDPIPFHDLDDHHIFPRKFLKDEYGITGERANTIVNRTLIVDSTNKKISHRSPSKYLKFVFPTEHHQAILASHLIDPQAAEAMANDDYESFLNAREETLLAMVREMIA